MIKCPKCNHTLVATTMVCQFCGTDVSQVPRPVEQKVDKNAYKMLSKSTLRGFYFVCGIQVALGIFEFLLGMGMFGSPGEMMKTVYEVYGLILALVGTLLMFRIAAIYQVSSAFCAVEVVLGVVFIISAPLTIEIPGLKWGIIVMGAIQMISAGFLFYFAEETAVGSMSA